MNNGLFGGYFNPQQQPQQQTPQPQPYPVQPQPYPVQQSYYGNGQAPQQPMQWWQNHPNPAIQQLQQLQQMRQQYLAGINPNAPGFGGMQRLNNVGVQPFGMPTGGIKAFTMPQPQQMQHMPNPMMKPQGY